MISSNVGVGASNDQFDEKALGRAIADARKNASLTQQELCEKLDISYSALTKIERGAIKAPSVFTVMQIAQVTGVSIESLLGLASAPAPLQAVGQVVQQNVTARNGIQFVYFDINGCMVRFFQRAFTEIAQEAHVSPEVVEDTFWHYNDAVCRGEMSLDDFNRTMAERVGIMIDWTRYYLSAIDPIMEVHECAAWAKSVGFKIGLLSNIMPGQISAMLASGMLPNLAYDAIVDSSAVGAIKPEQRIYDIAAQMANTEPSSILFVDDSRANLMAAEKLGWRVLWFDDFRPSESVERIKSTLEL